jgi:hypothetical protein
MNVRYLTLHRVRRYVLGMTEQPEVACSLSQRIGEAVRTFRTAGGWDQGLIAAAVSELGLPMDVSTVNRIESGRQAATLEQAVLLALVLQLRGIEGLLDPATPWRVGAITVTDAQALGEVLTGVSKASRRNPGGPYLQASRVVRVVSEARRDRMIADSLGAEPETVAAAAQKLFGRSAHKEVSARFDAKREELGDSITSESAAWRAHRAHAVRAVTREIGRHLEGTGK